MICRLLLLSACCLGLMTAAWGGSWRVPDDHGTIQAALDTAAEGDTITVAGGVYKETLTVATPVTLVAEGEVVVRSLDRQRAVLTIRSTGEVTITGFVFESADAQPSGSLEPTTEAVVLIENASPTLTASTIRNGSHSGVKVRGISAPKLTQCIVTGHGQSGVFVDGPDARPHMMQCRFEDNGANGVSFARGAQGRLEDCDLARNQGNGVFIAGRGTAPVVTGNRASENRFNGIVVLEGAGGLLEDNACRENGASGINLQVVNTALVVRNNRSEANTFSGLFVAQATGVTIEGNEFIGNGVISGGEIALLMRDDDFAALDALDAHLVATEARFPSGAWQLGYFYGFLLGGWGGTPRANNQSYEEWLDAWQAANPTSVAERVARAKWHIQAARTSRGAAAAEAVTMPGWEGFGRHLAAAYRALEGARAIAPSHPQALAEMVQVLGSAETIPENALTLHATAWTALDPAPPRSEAVFEEARLVAPLYTPLYTNRALFLMPRWGGAPGALEAFAATHADATADALGDGMYTLIANHVLQSFYLWTGAQAFFREFGFDWSRLVRGHRDLAAGSAQSTYWQQSLALFAALQADKAIASEVFTQLEAGGTDWDPEVWQQEDRFLTYRAWAIEDGAYPEISPTMQLALQSGDAEAVRSLLAQGEVVNAITDLGYSPLTYAVDRSDADIARVLLEAGADPDFQLFKGLAPIHKAAGRNDVGILDALLAAGADPNFLSEDGSTPLMFAAYAGRVGAIQRLVGAGADLNALHPTGSTALIVAVREGHVPAARTLIQAGADLQPITADGQSAKDLAQVSGKAELIALFEGTE